MNCGGKKAAERFLDYATQRAKLRRGRKNRVAPLGMTWWEVRRALLKWDEEAWRLAAGGTQEKFVDEEARETGRIVAYEAVLFEEIVENEFDFELEDLFGINEDGLGALGAITARDVRGDKLAIGNNRVDDTLANVVLDGAQMLTESVACGFARLGHEISNIDARGFGTRNGLGNFRNEEIGNDAGIERAGTHEDQVGILDGVDCFGKRAHAVRHEMDLPDGHAAVGDLRFPADVLAIGERGGQMDIGDGGGKDAAAYGKDFARDPNGFGEIAGDVSERGKEQVAEVVADEAAARMKTVLEEAAEQRFIFR